VKVGDVVYVGIHSTIQVELAEGTFHVVDEDEIVAIEDPS
jgi:co-chaperonin GroES (HSP10)